MRVGIDVGGTFTDVVLIDDAGERIHLTKVLTTPASPAEGVLAGIRKILEIAGASMADLDHIVHGHGTTIGTNALIERKGARTGLITTAGFRDVLEIARIERPDAGLYDIDVDTPAPLVPRHLRVEVVERIGSRGEVVVPLDEASVRRAARVLADRGARTIAVSTLFSFVNPAHERRIREIVLEELPGVFVSLSSEIAPEFREFERTSTTVINAYLQPILRRYVENLEASLAREYGPVEVRIMKASGGATTAQFAKDQAAATVNSGPAGGALASAFFGRLAGHERLITVDMGGTSFDIGLCDDGQPHLTSDGDFEGYPVKLLQIDVRGIGAGGGSIAWIDRGGALNVGPRSAGGSPGPACYGLGGEEPTVTDANVVLGRIDPRYFLGGEMALDALRAREAVERAVARPLGLSIEAAAHGILRVVNANMVKGIGSVSIERGHDPREFALVAFGGAGPLHAAELAAELGISTVLVPLYPGALSAFGLVTSDIRSDFVATLARPAAGLDPAELERAYAPLEDAARREMAQQRVPAGTIEMGRTADVRYSGQSYELSVGVPAGPLGPAELARVVAEFHALHQRIYEYGSPAEEVEFVNVRLWALGRVAPVRLPRLEPAGGPDPSAAARPSRPVWFGGRAVETAVHDRDRLRPGHRVQGPAIVEERISTTVVPPGWRADVDPHGILLLSRSA